MSSNGGIACVAYKRYSSVEMQNEPKSTFHSAPSPYTVTEEGARIVFENEYTRWAHDLEKGGALHEAIVKNGSGASILTAPQCVSVSIRHASKYRQFSSTQTPALSHEISANSDIPSVTCIQQLSDADGNTLDGITVTSRASYFPWGYSEHTVNMDVASTVENVGQVQVGALHVSPTMDVCGVRPPNSMTSAPAGQNAVRQWRYLSGGKKHADRSLYQWRYLPLSVLFFRRGIEGLQWDCGDDLAAWDNVAMKKDGWQMFFAGYRADSNSFEVRFCPVDANKEGLRLEGSYSFTYRLSLPFVRKHIVPLTPATTAFFPTFNADNEAVWPDKDTFRTWRKGGCTLMRLHNDGDRYGNGRFWRGGSYPPYPEADMKTMDQALADAGEAGIQVTPYFSAKELHPETKGFDAIAKECMRTLDADGEMLHNYCANGEFGVQMCLESAWHQVRMQNIDRVLTHHAFSGVYYDWCCGDECCNPRHQAGGGRHWDQKKLQELLEWSHKRVGEEGAVYLHLTYVPNVPAENLASLVLTEESPSGRMSPEMFSPHVHFMNIAPRQVIEMYGRKSCDDKDRRRFALLALLHHATVASVQQVYLDFYGKELTHDFTQYFRHTAPGEGICSTHTAGAGTSAYWNDKKALVLMVNMEEEALEADWQLDTRKMDWGWHSREARSGRASLAPLGLTLVEIGKHSRD